MRIAKIIVGLAITAWWIFMMRSVYMTEVAGHLDPGGPVIATLEPVDFWADYATARFEGREVGTIAVVLRHLESGGYSYEHRGRFEAQVLGRRLEAQLAGRALLSPELAVESFYYTARVNGERLDISGVVADKELRLRVENHEIEQVLPLDGPVRLDKSLTPFLVRRPDFAVGKKYSFTTFDPVTQQTREGKIEVLESEDENADYLLIARLDEMTVNSWITEDGQAVATSTSLGFETESITRESALLLDTRSDRPIHLYLSAVIPTGEIPRAPTQLDLRFLGLREEYYPLETPRQRRGDDFARFSMHAADRLDIDAADLVDPAWRNTRHVHGVVKSFAENTFGTGSAPRHKVEAILGWIDTNIEPVPDLGSPSGFDAYHDRRGDIRARTRLFADLARSAGLPVRLVSGLRHETGGFVAHFWAEVATPAGWVPVDPAEGRAGIPADYVAFRKDADLDEDFLQQLLRTIRLEVAVPENPHDQDS